MFKEPKFPLLDLLASFTSIGDLISPKTVGQGKQVSYIAFSIAHELKLPRQQQHDLIIAGLFHDISISSLAEKMAALQFQFDNATEHAKIGAQLLETSDLFKNAANLIRFHHQPWENGANDTSPSEKVPISSHILHLADRLAGLIDREQEVLGQVEKITRKVKTHSGKLFVPEIVDGFAGLTRKEHFWLDIISLTTGEAQLSALTASLGYIGMDDFTKLSSLFADIIDSQSRYTAMHTRGVVITAESLAKLTGFSETECQIMEAAGNLHDLGKLFVPKEILEKPATLTREESHVIMQHTFHTFRALDPFDNLKTIKEWASFHHERPDGTGYPFHLEGKDLSLGCRIMGVADVFAAMTEDRPWRKGMAPEESLTVLEQMATKSILDAETVKLLKANFKQINSARMAGQLASVDQYRKIRDQKEKPAK
jgi:HD-GYP domain-containing protein (c-di-GMP phosphodiesterase class II)